MHTFTSRDGTTIAYDVRGHGRSDAPHSQYTMAESQADLDALLAKLDEVTDEEPVS